MSKLINKKYIQLSLANFLLLTLFACSDNHVNRSTTNTSSLQSIKDRGELRIAVFSDKPPFGYIDTKGNSQGYDIELAKRLGKDLLGDEKKVKFIPTEAQNRINVLSANKVDITLANFTITPERKRQVDFAKPYMKTAIRLISRKEKPIDSVEALYGNILITNKGTTAEIFFEKNHPVIKQQKYDHNSEAFAALRDGRGLALAHDDGLLYAWAKANPDFIVTSYQIGKDDFIAPAVKTGNTELLNWINQEITQLQQEEFFHTAYKKTIAPYYGEEIDPNHIVIDASNLDNNINK